VDEREAKTELLLEHPGSRELARRVVEADYPCPRTHEPGRDIGGPAAKLDSVESHYVRQQLKLGLEIAPAPDRFLPGPRLSPSFDPVGRVLVPRGSVHEGVVVGRHVRPIMSPPPDRNKNAYQRAKLVTPGARGLAGSRSVYGLGSLSADRVADGSGSSIATRDEARTGVRR
jgi:hypothetical protein